MPGPVVAKPELPYWADPANASVFDAPGQGLLRKVVGLLGLDDPNQIMALGMPLEVGGMTGGLLEKVASKFPRFANAIKAYHGSPHDFEKFDVSKIGTGEGAQAYGHGLYFAEGEGVAKGYRDRLSAIPKHVATPESIMQHAVQSAGDAQRAADFVEQQAMAVKQLRPLRQEVRRYIDSPQFTRSEYDRLSAPLHAVEDLVHQIPGLATGVSEDVAEGVIPQLTQAAERLRRGELPPKGHMYEVQIKADPAHFLDWDKPLSQQSEHVQQALGVHNKPRDIAAERAARPGTPEYAALEREMDRRIGSPAVPDVTGAQFYRSDVLRGSADDERALSEYLKQRGIPGIKYLDQGSRATAGGELVDVVNGPQGWQSKIRMNRPNGEQYFTTSAPHATREAAEQWAKQKIADSGTRNFVVFDDKTVEILRKYGILLPAAGLAGKAVQPQAQQP